MFRYSLSRLLIAPAILALLGLVAAGCGGDPAATFAPTAATTGDLDLEALQKALDAIRIGEPSDAEIADILLLREEEKVARDVYLTLGGLYDAQIFDNIAESEQKHMDAVELLVIRYELADPVEDNGIGEFTDPHLQTMYDNLIAQGEQSLEQALLVGLAIEEIDILDLIHAMDRATLPDILKVFGNLCDGSESHLRAFVRNYESFTDKTYVPRWLTQAEYDAILAEDSDNGGGGGNGGSRGGRS